MPANYTADPAATQAPASPFSANTTLITAIPVDGDARNAATLFNQPYRVHADYIEALRQRAFYFYNVKNYGAKGDGSTDDTAAINLAIAAVNASATGGVLWFPPGIYLVSDALTAISNNYVQVLGSGIRATTMLFHPTAARICFKFSAGVSTQYNCSISGFYFLGAGAFKKTAIQINDASDMWVQDITVDDRSGGVSTWVGGTSVGLQIKGRQRISVNRYKAFCDLPLQISSCDNAVALNVVNCDHVHVSDTYLYATRLSSNPCLQIDDGIVVTNLTIDGDNAWITDGYAFYWPDTQTVNQGPPAYPKSYNVVIRNLRCEQSDNSSGYGIWIDNKTGLQTLTIDNVMFDPLQNGIWIKGVEHVLIQNSTFPANDNTKYHIVTGTGSGGAGAGACIPVTLQLINNNVQVNTLVSLTGLTQVFAVPTQFSGATMPPTALYVDSTTATNIPTQLGSTLTNIGTVLSVRGSKLVTRTGGGAVILDTDDTLTGGTAIALFKTGDTTKAQFDANGSVYVGRYVETMTAGPMSIGTVNPTSLTFSKSTVQSTFAGPLAMDELFLQSIGTALAVSANVIYPTKLVHHVGAGLIKNIDATALAVGSKAVTITLVPDAAFTTDATGNVAGASTGVVGRPMTATYDPGAVKWYLSY